MGRDRGSAVAGFALVVVPVAVLLLAVLQAVAYVRLHQLVAAAATEGARWAAASGRSTRDAGPVAERILGRSPAAGRVSCTAIDRSAAGGLVLVEVTCDGRVPAVLGPGHLPLHATARTVREGT